MKQALSAIDGSPQNTSRWQHLIAPAVFALLTLGMFYRVLFQSDVALSSRDADLSLQFFAWRDFGFSQLRHGHLPLWNPYVYGGTPYFAGFQSALLYPLNWLHLFLPLLPAINWNIAVHTFLAGYFTSLWARGRGASIAGSILAGSMFMFGGTYYLHIYAGHLPHLCLMVWLPLILLSIEGLARKGSPLWCMSGIGAMAMALLAGHPQYIYYTGIITAIYTVTLLIGCRSKGKLIGGYVLIMTGASAVAAVQLLAGMQAAGESVRSGGVSFEFASMFALPPENLLTLLVPNFFGTLPTVADPHPAVDYFGRCYLWEMSVFVSVTGFCLAVLGGSVHWKRQWRSIVMIAIALVLALGKHLPLYRVLFDYLPMFGSFRDVAKFTVFFSLFISVLAADGFDVLLKWPRHARSHFVFATFTAAGAIALFIFSILVHANGDFWHGLLKMIGDSKELFTPIERYVDPLFLKSSSLAASAATRTASLVLLIMAAVVIATRYWRHAAYGLVLLAIGESFVIASSSYTTTNGAVQLPDGWMTPIHQLAGDDRVLNAALPAGAEIQYLDQGLALGYRNIWGYDPGVLKRYAELLTAAQGIPAENASQYLPIQKASTGLLQMLRCRLALVLKDKNFAALMLPAPLPRAQLVSGWTLDSQRDSALRTVLDKDFDPRQSVSLQSRPSIIPSSSGATGPAEATEVTTDEIDIRARTDAPTLLLISENYSTGWLATAVGDEPEVQDHYDIVPADYAIMAIPLTTGTHHIRLQYRPDAFVIGKWISIVSVVFFMAAVGWIARRRSGAPVPSPVEPGEGTRQTPTLT